MSTEPKVVYESTIGYYELQRGTVTGMGVGYTTTEWEPDSCYPLDELGFERAREAADRARTTSGGLWRVVRVEGY